MPELLRVETPDFEFSVWANDISQCQSAYRKTLEKRGSKIEHALEMPLFFENTQYQFEWVFLKPVENARLTHRSQTVNDGFRFIAQRGAQPARLTGTINTGNDVGWMPLPLEYEHQGKTIQQNMTIEVLPTKMALHQELPAMYQDIDQTFPLWRFSLVEKTEQNAAKDKHRGDFPLMWLANFSRLRERFEQGLSVISQAPHSRLQPEITYAKAARLKGRIPYKLSTQVKEDFANGQYDKYYRAEKKRLCVDTPENRFIKMAVTHSKKQLANFEQRLRISNQKLDKQRLSDTFLNEIHCWQKPLQKMLAQSFLKEVSDFSGLNSDSLVLQQKTGYSAVAQVWQELKFYLDMFANQSSISMKSVAEIYEVWCFLSLKQILQNELGFKLITNHKANLALNKFFEYQLKDGMIGAFKFERTDGVKARLAHEPKFTKKGKAIRSYIVNQEPDIVLEVSIPNAESSQAAKQFIWLFDAKYRIKTDKNRFDDENIDHIDYVPDDAINQMHRYRDALIHLTTNEKTIGYDSANIKKSRPVFGAFALYPGFFDQEKEKNPYAEAITEIGIGAFALLPTINENKLLNTNENKKGHRWLLDFLQEQIGGNSPQMTASRPSNMAEGLYIQDASRIPHYGMQQVLYPDLTMTVALGDTEGRDSVYFDNYRNGSFRFYHTPIKTFALKLQLHIAQEIRFLAIIPHYLGTEPLSKVWPVHNVKQMPRNQIDLSITGKHSASKDLYFVFELGQPLTLPTTIAYKPDGTFRYTMKLTTLSKLESVQTFNEIEWVYQDYNQLI